MKHLSAWLPVVCLMAIIFYLSHQPATSSSELSSSVMTVIMNPILNIFPFIEVDLLVVHTIVRKLAHFGAYLILALFVMRALTTYFVLSVNVMVSTLFICVIYAMTDEIHQLFIEGRSGEVRDILIDSIGAFVGIVLYAIIQKLRSK